jgi:hypothetical protein
MKTKLFVKMVLAFVLLAGMNAAGCSTAQQNAETPGSPGATTMVGAQQVPSPPDTPPPAQTDPWPRNLTVAGTAYVVYSPQVVKWSGDHLSFRVAVGVQPAGAHESYGVVSGTARAQVDRMTRLVDLADFGVLELKFPLLPDNGRAYTSGIKEAVTAALATVSLNRVEASLVASQTVKPAALPVKDTPPRIIVSHGPALLVPIDGAPVIKDVPDSSFERVINTEALIARSRFGDTWYLHVYDGWMCAKSLSGPWTVAASAPSGLDDTAQRLAKSHKVDLLTGANAVPKPSLSTSVPAIYVTQTPSELIIFKGTPNFVPVTGTSLLWANNTAADVFVDTKNNNTYILISGRWYTASDLNGPWRFVAPDALPPDFKHIPKDGRPGVVLASVAGTPEAAEAMIENTIPQTATVSREDGPKFLSSFDGAPQYAPVADTPLHYVVNSRTPIIEVSPSSFYAVQGGVWFTAPALTGPWAIATSVPAVIYTIPVTSPLHYVTYVYVYGYTSQVVYVGYTPGYLGTVVAPGGVVVYGTGYVYTPWIGTVWYPPPVTWGIAAAPVYNPAVGFTWGFALGLATAAIATPYWGGAYYHVGYWGYPCCGSASADVYRSWGRGVSAGTRTWYANSGGTVGTYGGGIYSTQRGTSGSYWGQRSYNPYTGQGSRSYGRTFTTAGGTTGKVTRGETYNAATGQRSYGSSASATGTGGSSVSRNVKETAGPQGYGRSATTTTYNAHTGQTNTWTNGRPGDDNHYGDADGNVYRNTGSGWQRQTASGWQSASGDTSWADREQQARSTGESGDRSFDSGMGGWDRSGSGTSSWASRFGGSGGDSWGDRFGGGFGGGNRSFGGGSWGDRFSGSSFSDRFGGFGGGRFGGFRR